MTPVHLCIAWFKAIYDLSHDMNGLWSCMESFNSNNYGSGNFQFGAELFFE